MKFLAIPLLAAALIAADPNYARDVEQYRAHREAELKQDDGWLTVVGLIRLKEGDNDIPQIGKVTFSEGHASYNGRSLKPNTDIVTVGAIKFFVIKRGEEYFVRVKDNNAETRRNFTGLKWFPVDPSWKLTAKFTPYAEPKTILFDSQNGVKQPMKSPGFVSFTRDGVEYRLDPVTEGSQLFFIFRDATSNKSTYGAARFLYAAPAKDGTVILDFNKAINPPCAFTAYATCPLPPPQNRLKLAVTAGEKKYSDAIE
ncbi:MAG: DUF1684 domain-containing protein [Bryobacteraceae bacterium]